MNKNLVLLLLFILLIEGSFALTASSQSYSISMFGNGIASGDSSSGNYNAVYLSEGRGTTRNAESSSFRGNIGFFEDNIYYRTVSITSYSISPDSVVIGSTITFSISALNAEQVWAKITPPNSQEYILNLVNGQSVSHLPIPSVVGVYQVIFYARSSTGAIASVVDSFELTAQSGLGNSGIGSGASSGGGSTIIERCTYNWDCTPWSVCSNGVQRRTCVNIGTCTGIQSKPIEETTCSEALFDISLRLDDLSVDEDGSIKFNVDLTEKIGVEKIDVHVKYSIIDSDDQEIFSQIETRAVQGKLSYEKVIDDLNLVDGNYILRTDILYGNLQRAFAEQSFIILDGRLSSTITGFAGEGENLGKILNTPLLLLILFVLIIMLILYYVFRRRMKLAVGSVLRLKGLEVYTSNGLRFGVVRDVVVKDNVIYGLAVELDGKLETGLKRVLVRYSYVQSVKDVVVIDSYCLDYLLNHRNSFKNDLSDVVVRDPVAQPG